MYEYQVTDKGVVTNAASNGYSIIWIDSGIPFDDAITPIKAIIAFWTPLSRNGYLRRHRVYRSRNSVEYVLRRERDSFDI
mmetsp:Transcript_13403/g.15950  ORF Transcript_13403/g.15950 Transcript_13403/m.15950 type:complete len:80 (-) Transcript_13403:407-646(-)